MKILLVAPMPPSATAALAVPRVLHAQLVGLSERHEVALAVVAGPEEPELRAVEELRATGADLHAVCRHEPRTGHERWSRRRRLADAWLRRGWPWRTGWYHDTRLQGVIDRLRVERRFDVVSVEDNAAAVYDFGNVPTVFTEHEVRRPRPLRAPGGPLRSWPGAAFAELDWRRWPRYHRATWPRFDLVQVFTERDADAVRELAPAVAARVRVNPFGLELPDPLEPAPPSSREVVFVGNFTHPPNVDAAVWLGSEIMPGLRAKEAAARLTVIGPAAPEAVRSLACDDIRVTGAVPDLRPFLTQAAVVLAPIRIGGGMRMKVLEAMALRRAVVTTTRGTEGLEPARGAAVAVADTGEAFVREVDRLLSDPAARAALGDRALAYAVANHSARAYADRLERVYDEARERRG
jgi:glycosyltransferase involved in cell wall biosynthesis